MLVNAAVTTFSDRCYLFTSYLLPKTSADNQEWFILRRNVDKRTRPIALADAACKRGSIFRRHEYRNLAPRSPERVGVAH